MSRNFDHSLILDVRGPEGSAARQKRRQALRLGDLAAQEAELGLEEQKARIEEARRQIANKKQVAQIRQRGLSPQEEVTALRQAGAHEEADALLTRYQAEADKTFDAVNKTPGETLFEGSTLSATPGGLNTDEGSDSVLRGTMTADIPAGEIAPVEVGHAPIERPGMMGPTKIRPITAREFSQMNAKEALAKMEEQSRLKREEAAEQSANRRQELETAAALRPEPPVNNDTVVTQEGVKQWNPETRRFDIPVGGRPLPAQSQSDASRMAEGADLQAYVNSLSRGEIQPPNVPIGIRDKVLRLAQDQGVAIMTDREREGISSLDTASEILKDVKKYSDKIHTGEGLGARATGLIRQGKSAAGYDADVTSLQSKAGELALIVRALGERGALAEGDVARALLLIPVNPRLTKTEAQNQLRDLESIFTKVRDKRFETTTQPMRTNAPSMAPVAAPKGAKGDPLGIR